MDVRIAQVSNVTKCRAIVVQDERSSIGNDRTSTSINTYRILHSPELVLDRNPRRMAIQAHVYEEQERFPTKSDSSQSGQRHYELEFFATPMPAINLSYP